MISRRFRLQARPNLKGTTTKHNISSETTKNAADGNIQSSDVQSKSSNDSKTDLVYPSVSEGSHASSLALENTSAVHDACVPSVTNTCVDKPEPSNSDRRHSETISTEADSVDTGSSNNILSRKRTVSNTPSCSFSPPLSPHTPRNRRKFKGTEPLDPKTMTMFDLISWNPKYEKGLRGPQIEEEKTEKTGNDSPKNPPAEVKKKVAAPQVKIAEDGTLILDESSLTVTNEEKQHMIWETVNEDRGFKKISSLSFRKNPLKRGTSWSELETDLFYEVLRATGPDFGLMHEFFPSRTRPELKLKFNREERTNWERLKYALESPTILDDSLYKRASKMAAKVKEEQLKRMSEKTSKKSKINATVTWNEDEADLIAEAEDEILRIQQENETSPSSSGRQIKTATSKKNREKNRLLEETEKEALEKLKQKQLLSRKKERQKYSSIYDDLDDDFPDFEIIEEPGRKDVAIEKGDGGPPVVRIPKGVTAVVCHADDEQPQRVKFVVPGENGASPTEYLIQHQLGPSQPTTGFLHLFASL
ncbi:hypothetical protein AB6A40_000234 [Gnathostoma spinigerum]|uniref:Myb-like domain-containing protein n=1 Tax=Gnathostoma spinigerum TaxID=75299 RepID=A0ABD6E2L8_9BILA